MDKRIIAIGVFIVLLILVFMFGYQSVEQCVEIGSCRGCWLTKPVQIKSPLCSNQTCTPEPYKVQHNVLVDVILCACDDARASDFTDPVLNGDISETYREMTCALSDDKECGYTATPQEVCSGSLLTKWGYE